jgi:rhamnose utilization protein RhaD (predicted bifunctional aldolase and dehydrogenase)/NAD(P)-dependent dehydrogenase (short-subunit alcohol dehydrogenase family)
MRNLWSDSEAEAFATRHANRDLGLRVYTTRLLGGEKKLVLHGGGNTSVKTMMKDISGDDVEVLCVKGSGWDMGSIEAPGLPAVRLAPLRRLASLEALSDEDMVNVQRINLLDSNAPNPSVETLLHAFLPHKFIDHSHADALVGLTDQAKGADYCREIFGDRLALVPYIMPGFKLAKKAAEVFAAYPNCQGLVLLKHGLFTFADTAKEAYDLHIEFVTLAEERLAKGRPAQIFVPTNLPKQIADLSDVAPILRGLVSEPISPEDGLYRRLVCEFRSSPAILDFVNGRELSRYGQVGPVTPDHCIRTKPKALILPAPEAGKLDEFAKAARQALDQYIADYRAYFARHNATAEPKRKPLDPMPRVVFVPGLGLFGLGANMKDARIVADLAETSVSVIADSEALGPFEIITEAEMFEFEHWPLEQAKLGKAAEKPLARQIVAVTGGGSGIGAATAKCFAKAGAEVVVLDRDLKAASEVAKAIGGIAVVCDVTDAASVKEAFAEICRKRGGLDILVSNAGAAWQGKIGEVDEAVLRQSFELNFFGHQRVSQAAVAIMKKQGTGGCLLFNVSKQAVNPGKDFGPYGLPKAALMFLMRQYALDHGRDGIRSNAVNADRIRSGLLTGEMVQSRSKARGLSERDYMAGNLLGREVSGEDVGEAFVTLALANKTSAAVLTVDGGNIEASLR